MPTFTDIVNRIIETTGRSDKSSTIQGRVTDSLLEIQRLHNHYFAEQLSTTPIVVDQQDYAVPTDFKDIKNLYLQSSDGTWGRDPLPKLTMEFAREKYNADDTGDPEGYTVYRSAIFVWPPKPKDDTKKLLLEYWKFLAAISGTSTNELTITWPDLVEAWATWKFYAKLPAAEEQAKFWQAMAFAQQMELVKYTNDQRLKTKTVMPIRTSPRERDRSRFLPFGGR